MVDRLAAGRRRLPRAPYCIGRRMLGRTDFVSSTFPVPKPSAYREFVFQTKLMGKL